MLNTIIMTKKNTIEGKKYMINLSDEIKIELTLKEELCDLWTDFKTKLRMKIIGLTTAFTMGFQGHITIGVKIDIDEAFNKQFTNRYDIKYETDISIVNKKEITIKDSLKEPITISLFK